MHLSASAVHDLALLVSALLASMIYSGATSHQARASHGAWRCNISDPGPKGQAPPPWCTSCPRHTMKIAFFLNIITVFLYMPRFRFGERSSWKGSGLETYLVWNSQAGPTSLFFFVLMSCDDGFQLSMSFGIQGTLPKTSLALSHISISNRKPNGCTSPPARNKPRPSTF